MLFNKIDTLSTKYKWLGNPINEHSCVVDIAIRDLLVNFEEYQLVVLGRLYKYNTQIHTLNQLRLQPTNNKTYLSPTLKSLEHINFILELIVINSYVVQ